MLNLNDFRYFVEVVDRGGFASAGRSLQRPTSTVSNRIKQLERELSLTLLSRTSRSISLTEPGSQFYEHAVEMLQRALDAEMAMRDIAGKPVGKVRYTVAVATGQYAMQDMVVAFLAAHPHVMLEQHACDAPLDIVVERFDFAIRGHFGPLPDSGLIQRPLATVPWHLVAAPDLFLGSEIPQSPDDLASFNSLFLRRDNADPAWSLKTSKGPEVSARLSLNPRISGSCITTLKTAAVARMGIVALPAYVCRDEISSGQLVRVLPDWIAAESSISALMPSRRGMTAAARAFLDHIAECFPNAVGSRRLSH